MCNDFDAIHFDEWQLLFRSEWFSHGVVVLTCDKWWIEIKQWARKPVSFARIKAFLRKSELIFYEMSRSLKWNDFFFFHFYKWTILSPKQTCFDPTFIWVLWLRPETRTILHFEKPSASFGRRQWVEHEERTSRWVNCAASLSADLLQCWIESIDSTWLKLLCFFYVH